jgi:pyruvate/2-oxoglutarate dehydrogenase complex dihydrolipoamide dehydrogenase (E3) component
MKENFDVIIVGSGQAGKPLATAFAEAGKKTAIVESHYVGGTCTNTGCTPTKTMVASARIAYLARRSSDYGVSSGPVSVDMAAVRNRKRGIVEHSRSNNEKKLTTTANLELIRGLAKFTGQKSIEVDLSEGGTRTLQAETIFINTGLRNAIPKVPGIESTPTLDNESIMELDSVPEHLMVLGGGYIGLEFGQMFRRFGSRVTVVHRGKQLLDHEDSDIAGEVAKILAEDGIEILLNAKATKVDGTAGEITVSVEAAGSAKVIQGSHLLTATGRTPNTEALHLDLAGVATDEHGYIKVNDRLETTAAGVYALGDVKGGPAFTHISYDDYRVAKANLIDGGRRTTTGRQLPYTVYIDPQLGRIGLTERQAREQGRKIRVAKMPMSSVARAIETGETRGVMKIIVEADSGLILGAAILGIEGGETAAAIQMAMLGGLPFTALRDGIFAHPTLAEGLNNVFFHWEDSQ